MLSIGDIATFCKRKGFVYPSSEVYGGLSGFFDYGPLGVELFNNLKQHWWKFFVRDREDMVGIEASVISHPRIWKASGHVDSFTDVLVRCSKCKTTFRADHLVEEKAKVKVEGLSVEELGNLIIQHKLSCPNCKGAFEPLQKFNLLFVTNVGPSQGSANTAYIRGETAQGMFTDFKLIVETARQKIPFGIAQVGRCFRNEIAPRDFLFRSREFTIGEFEFFIHPNEERCPLETKQSFELPIQLLDRASQAAGKDQAAGTTIGKMVQGKKLSEWHGYWLGQQLLWLQSLGISPAHLRVREHVQTELSHYSSATFDIEYLYPFGWKEFAGNADRGQFDLTQHMKESKEKLEIFDEASKSKIIPRVIEPTFGMDRVFLALLAEGYHDDQKRGNIVLQLLPKLAPFAVGVFPLVNKVEEEAKTVFGLLKNEFSCFFDTSGSIGRRYARADEIGIPFCVTIDFDTLKDGSVTIRNRDSTKQIRVERKALVSAIHTLIGGGEFSQCGREVSKSQSF